MFRKSFLISLLILFTLGAGRSWYALKKGFNINRITCDLRALEKISEIPSSEIKDIFPLLDSPYFFLGSGRQCYAFISQDGHTVLKIPRFDKYNSSLVARATNLSRETKNEKTKRLKCLLESFRISYEDLGFQTGVFFLHFHKTDQCPRHFKLVDALGRSHQIDLNQYGFILQEYAPLLFPLVSKSLTQNDFEGATIKIQAFIHLLKEQAALGIFNKDLNLFKNFSWFENRVLQIDIGDFYRKPHLSQAQAYEAILQEGTQAINKWLLERNFNYKNIDY